jgi:hypothetical protein
MLFVRLAVYLHFTLKVSDVYFQFFYSFLQPFVFFPFFFSFEDQGAEAFGFFFEVGPEFVDFEVSLLFETAVLIELVLEGMVEMILFVGELFERTSKIQFFYFSLS